MLKTETYETDIVTHLKQFLNDNKPFGDIELSKINEKEIKDEEKKNLNLF